MMSKQGHSFVVGEDGERTAVIEVEEYRRLLEAAEELESVRVYDAAKASGKRWVPFEEALH
jgi:hypothetical protein